MTAPRIRIAGSGAICPIGTGVAQIWAAVRAGISRTAFSLIQNRHLEPIKMALLPDEVLSPLPPELLTSALTSSQRRTLSLSIHALKEAMAEPPEAPPPLFIGLAETPKHHRMVDDEGWMKLLLKTLGPSIDKNNSRIFPSGRAATFVALRAACDALRAGRCTTALVGGVDTFLDLARLAELDDEERLLGERTVDGFIPGEGAAFVLLTTKPAVGDARSSFVGGVGTSHDVGHRYSDEPNLGEGVANAIEAMRGQLGQLRSAAQVVFAGLNGEGFGAKAWGVARLRHSDIISPEAMIEHPADCFGDLGAALGAMMLVLADASLVLSHREPPALAWAESDRGVYGCAWLDPDESLG